MTPTPPPTPPRRGPAGMPAHLWELARSDVRLAVPDRVRNAVASGAEAPAGVRRVAARIAAVGAAAGVPAAIVAVGGVGGPGLAHPSVVSARHTTPLDDGPGLDPAPAVPGSGWAPGDGGVGGVGGGTAGGTSDGDGGGAASAFTTGTGDVSAGLGTTWRVQEGGPGADGDWLTIQMFQDVTVTETADGMFVVDAWQYVVIRDDDGNEYVFREHYQVVVPDPPGAETDLVIHERGHVHVVERPDGGFDVVSTDFGIEVTAGADGDGRDEVGIGQDQQVRITDADGNDDDVTVTLSEAAVSTSDDEGDEAVTTIEQDQVVGDGELPPEPPWAGGRSDGPDLDRIEPTGRGGPAPGSSPGPGAATGPGPGSGPVAVTRPADAVGAPAAGLAAPVTAGWAAQGRPEGGLPDVRIVDGRAPDPLTGAPDGSLLGGVVPNGPAPDAGSAGGGPPPDGSAAGPPGPVEQPLFPGTPGPPPGPFGPDTPEAEVFPGTPEPSTPDPGGPGGPDGPDGPDGSDSAVPAGPGPAGDVGEPAGASGDAPPAGEPAPADGPAGPPLTDDDAGADPALVS